MADMAPPLAWKSKFEQSSPKCSSESQNAVLVEILLKCPHFCFNAGEHLLGIHLFTSVFPGVCRKHRGP